ncbi:SusD/RagB family nutrient-binding outer membrane lipoprotein [Sphingobacterium bovistauri]|uniref:SusD/RagB family nutrient-binding outer membrane lipoprotein n=1 Tax=Sphingobacterium bovistauri TaxID=2781959 RepID=A0ABS7Z2B6_9SPHI|nr:SusD/RagB family nutrient-binding outer membrane lipoprotein [Sphingobacterium bovistauri]MCA5003717.1 SusD/RagB family nutrient-binding outer membrane lipoprotein [Sphingobacterium bovistauri]
MKNKLFIYILLFNFIALFGCNKFDELNSNPNATTDVNASMLATTVILKNLKFGGRDAMEYVSDNGVAKYVAYANQSIMSSQYAFLGPTTFDNMTILPNIDNMLKYSTGIPAENSYKGLAKFSRAFMFYQLSMKVGDIPYKQAGKGLSEGLTMVPYDAQEEVMKGVLSELKEAEEYFAKGITFAGDPTPYGGDPKKWRRAVNTFRLKVLLSLSKRDGNSSIPVKQEFSNIVQSGELLEESTGHLGLNYSAVNVHPLYSTNTLITSRVIMSSLLVNQLKSYNDRRLFYYGEPAASEISGGKLQNNFNAYVGAEVAENYDVNTAAYLQGKFSGINLRYQKLVTSDPRIIVSYAEQQLILAEARILGWISTGTAKEYYESGTKAALKNVMNTDQSYAHGMAINQAYIDGYFTGEALFKTDQSDQLKQIWIQKYFLNYMQDPTQSYYEYRRTGYPIFPISSSTSLNVNKKEAIPMRWLYPSSEITRNQSNLMEALNRQYGGNDEINQVMWLLK